MTGTLLNGYAAGIFYMLFRTCPQTMRREGFSYDGASENEFTKEYGVYKTVQSYLWENGRQGDRVKTRGDGTKALPGVSPLVYTKFLMNNAVFMGLDDISDALPGYEEIPVGVTMDPEVASGYQQLEQDIRGVDNHGNRRGRESGETGNSMKTMAQAVQALGIYPDRPYDQPPILHPDTGLVVATPRNVARPEGDFFSKELRLMDIIRSRIADGEKVLVYYSNVNRVDMPQVISEQLKKENISCTTLTSKVKPKNREEWIAKQAEKGLDVLFVNPELVKTGLDLLDFTSIIFYEMGYNLFTLRQASRRSWRLSQTKDVKVYFLYYRGTTQEIGVRLMATKLQASMAIEGRFSEEGFNALSDNDDVLSQIAASVTDGIKETVDAGVFASSKKVSGAGAIRLKEKMEERAQDAARQLERPDALKSILGSKEINRPSILAEARENGYSSHSMMAQLLAS